MTDYSKWAELSASLDAEDVSDANATPADAPDDLMGGDSDDENAHLDPEYRVEHCEEDDVGTTIEVFPKTHGEGAITKKVIASGVEYDNPKDGWAVELSYVARVIVGGVGGEPFETKEKEVLVLGEDSATSSLPPGVMAGLKTMRELERALITVQPAKAFGATGDASRGVPPESVVAYEMTVHRIIEINTLEKGRVVKWRMERGQSWDKPSENDEVSCSWAGWLKGDRDETEQEAAGRHGALFHQRSTLKWIAGDASVPAVFNTVVVGKMLKKEVARIEITPEDFRSVAGGFERYGVPEGRTVVLSVTLLSWVSVEDISAKGGTGKLMKRVITPGEGWEKPRPKYFTTIDLQIRRTPDDPVPLARSEGLEVVVGKIGESSVVSGLAKSCSGVDLAATLEIALPKMAKGEECELRCHPTSTDNLLGLSLLVKLVSWVLVETVPSSYHEVTRRVVTEATVGVYERPTPLSSVQVRYTVRAAGGGEIIESSGDDPRTFIVSDGPLSGVLPCIDVGVREMRKGERDVLLAPAGWAYASPEYVPPNAAAYPSAVEKAAEGVEVEIELIDFTRGKDFYQLTADEKLAEMAKYRENGNRLFKAGHFKRAARRYEEALKKEPKEKDDFASVASAEKAARLEEVRKIKLSAHLNLAACHLKLNEPQLALEQSNGALEIDLTSVKALYRRGQARLLLGDVEGARSDLLEAAKRDPQNRDVRKELERLKAQAAALKQQQKNLFGGMFAQ